MNNQLISYEYTPILGWSVSRYETFISCKRAYFYNYYGKYDDQIPLDEIKFLKKLTSIPLEKGNILHDIIRDLLIRLTKTSREIDKTKLYTYIYNMVKKYCSRKIFSEVYYHHLDKIDIDAIFNDTKRALISFLKSNRFDWLLENAIRYKDEWVIEPAGFGETRLMGLKAYCKVDFFFPIEDDYYILDWKSGKHYPEKHRKQLLAYSLWAKESFQLSAQHIKPIIAFFTPEYNEIGEEFLSDDLDSFQSQIKAETQEMYSYCSKIEENVPLYKIDFPKTENYFTCAFCNFRKLCGLENL